MICLVTGCTGLIGSELCRELLKKGHKVIGVSRNKKPYENIINHKNFSYLKKNLSIEGLKYEELNGVEIIFHLAGLVFNKEKSEIDYLNNNEIASFNLFNSYCKSLKYIVLASTQMVYGNPNNKCVDEKFSLDDVDTSYGYSKINSENWLKWFSKKQCIPAASFRISGVIEDEGAVIAYFINMAKKNKNIDIYSMGEICRDYISVDDIVQVFINSIEGGYYSPGFQAYNIGSGQAVKMIDIAKLICNELGSSSEIIPIEKKAPRSNFVYNIDKAKKELDFSPMSLKEGIIKHINSIKEREGLGNDD